MRKVTGTSHSVQIFPLSSNFFVEFVKQKMAFSFILKVLRDSFDF